MKVQTLAQPKDVPVVSVELTQDELDKLVAVLANCHSQNFQDMYDGLSKHSNNTYMAVKMDGGYLGTIDVKERTR